VSSYDPAIPVCPVIVDYPKAQAALNAQPIDLYVTCEARDLDLASKTKSYIELLL